MKQRIGATERQRRLRERQRRGEVVALVPINYDVINMLVETGRLLEDSSKDRGAIGLALSRLALDIASRRA